jgi:protein TonB
MFSHAHQAPPFGDDAGTSVIAFPRRNTGGGPVLPVVVNAEDTPAPPVQGRSATWALLLVSMAAHAGILAAFFTPPQPLPTAGIPAITVEIVLGDNAAAGLASSQGQDGATEVKPTDAPTAEATELEPEAVRPVAPAETPAVTALPEVASPALSQDVVAVTPHVPPTTEQRPDSKTAQAQPEHVRRELEEVPPDQVAAASKPPQRAQTPSSAAGGISRGGSAAGANYQGRVAAHLARHKRFPPEARRRGQHGSAGIDFSIDGRGRVTAVRIARSSGHVSLDRAAEAMVWRASPFPAPPDGRPQRFSVPVSYSIR